MRMIRVNDNPIQTSKAPRRRRDRNHRRANKDRTSAREFHIANNVDLVLAINDQNATESQFFTLA